MRLSHAPWLTSLLLLAGGAIAQPSIAASDAKKVTLHIAPQPVGDALSEFGRQTGLTVMIQSVVGRGVMSPKLDGDYAPVDALDQLLAHTGLHYEYLDDKTVAVLAANSSATSSSSTSGVEASLLRDAQMRVARGESEDAQPDASPPAPTAGEGSQEKNSRSKDRGIEEVIITGTHIRGDHALAPVITLTHDDLIAQGYTRLDEALEQLPQNFKGGVSAVSNPISGAGDGAISNYSYASGVNLRGLGPSSTLILLDGRRLAQTAQGSTTDISGIPLSIIDRVEIVADGASAIYGADAVAGVVNIITKKTFDGIEAAARASNLSSHKSPNDGGNLMGGTSWGSGSALINFDYERDVPLYASQRSFANTAPNPTGLLPGQTTSSAYTSLNQSVGNGIDVTGNAVYSSRNYQNHVLSPGDSSLINVSGRAQQLALNGEIEADLPHEWRATLVGQYSRERDRNDLAYVDVDTQYNYEYEYQVKTAEARIDGSIFDLPAGALRLALGLDRRWESFDEQKNTDFGTTTVSSNYNNSRNVSSAYLELLIPIVSPDQAVPLVRSLTMNLAGRYDKYSDFGSTSNPKFSLKWGLSDSVSLTGSYSKSYQAPALFLLDPSIINTGYVLDVADPAAASGTSRALELDGTNPNLGPQTARTKTLELAFAPNGTGVKLSASYFDIEYSNRIQRLTTLDDFFSGFLQESNQLGSLVTRNPSLAQVTNELSQPGRTILDGTNGYCTVGAPGCPSVDPATIQAIAHLGYENVSLSTVQGMDFGAHYEVVTRIGRVYLDESASYFIKYDARYTPNSPVQAIVGTIYNPVRFRNNLNWGWNGRLFGANARLNYVGKEQNPYDASCTTANCSVPVASWTTVDLSLSYAVPTGSMSILNGLQAHFSITNLFNRDPPYAFNATGVNYDPVNADPLGRAFSLYIAKRW